MSNSKIYINDSEIHNKFWLYETNQNNFDVLIKWGRVGTIGQSKNFEFTSSYGRDDFIEKKTREKLRGGYAEIAPEEFEVKTTISKIIGVESKIDDIKFVVEKSKNRHLTASLGSETVTTLSAISTDKLSDPSIKPAVYAKITGRKNPKTGQHPVIEFLFRVDQSYKIMTGVDYTSSGTPGRYLITSTPIKPGDDCEELASAVGEVIVRVLV